MGKVGNCPNAPKPTATPKVLVSLYNNRIGSIFIFESCKNTIYTFLLAGFFLVWVTVLKNENIMHPCYKCLCSWYTFLLFFRMLKIRKTPFKCVIVFFKFKNNLLLDHKIVIVNVFLPDITRIHTVCSLTSLRINQTCIKECWGMNELEYEQYVRVNPFFREFVPFKDKSNNTNTP